MSRILEKLGVYDLFVLLLTGIIILSVTVYVDQEVLNWQIAEKIVVGETFSFLIVSYLIGLLFQEVSSYLYRHTFNRNERLLKKSIKVKRRWQPKLCKEEKGLIRDKLLQIPELVKEKNGRKKVCWPIAYTYCKIGMTSSDDITRNERDQYTAGVSRSLAVYCALLALTVTWKFIEKCTCKNMVYIVVSIVLMLLMHHRYVRFTYMRYLRTFRSFCLNPKKEDREKESK